MSYAEQPLESWESAPDPPTMPRVAVAVVEHDDAERGRIVAMLDGAAPFASLEDLMSRITGASPVVAVLGPSCAGAADLALVETLISRHPEVGAVLLAVELSTQVLQQALRVGVRDVLSMPIDAKQLVVAIQKIAVGLEVAPPRRTANEPPAASEEYGEPGRVITVFSTKGGAGKSVISTNLAVALAMHSDRPVCLVDADLQFGDVAVMLKLTPQHTIVDAVAAIDRMDVPLLSSLLTTHESTGLKVLPAPLEPAFADRISAQQVTGLVEVLRSFCAFVVVDTPAYFNDVVLGLVEVSDEIVLVAGMDIPNIKNVKIGLQTLRLLNTPMEKLRLVLNRADSKVKLDIGEVERTLQIKAEAFIPSDVIVPQAVNKGVPVVTHAPRSGVAKSLEGLADLFLHPEVQQKHKRR